MKKIVFIILVTIFCSKAFSFEIKTNFSNGTPIPKEHACKSKGGEDLSIPVEFKNIPENTKSFALIIDDPDAVPVAGKIWVHWVVIDIPPSNTKLEPTKKGKLDFGLIATNRDFHVGGSGSVVEFDSLINFLDDYVLDLNYARSDTQEGNINFIDTEDTFAGRTYAMDGESFSGTAKNFRLRWAVNGRNAGIRFSDVSPTYRAHVGFVGRNNYKYRNYWYGRTYRSQGTIRRISFNFNNRNRLSSKNEKVLEFYEFQVDLETNFNFTGTFEWQHKPSEKYNGIQYGQQRDIEIRGQYHPSERFYSSFKIEKGESIAYRIDNPEIGDSTEYNLYNVFRFSDNFKIALGHRYSELKNKVTGEEFYAGEINRFELDYQVDGALSTRTIIEKNDFSDDYFLEALIQWKPNPYTIFYAGGTQFYKEPNPFSGNLRLETSQIYAKFQYFYNPNK